MVEDFFFLWSFKELKRTVYEMDFWIHEKSSLMERVMQMRCLSKPSGVWWGGRKVSSSLYFDVLNLEMMLWKHELNSALCLAFTVTITLLPCQYLDTLEKNKGDPMYLGVKKPQSCLSCTKNGDQPVLQLRVSLEKKELLSPGQRKGPHLFTKHSLSRNSDFQIF